jgi:hypothetical protein
VILTFYGRSLIDIIASTFYSGPVFYVLMWLTANISGAHAFIILKVTAPLLYGGLALSFLFFLRRGLKLEWRMAFVAAVILVFQIAALRESWDRFRDLLGLIFLFVALTSLKSNLRFKKWLVVGVLAVLTVLSRDYIGGFLLVTILGSSILEKGTR